MRGVLAGMLLGLAASLGSPLLAAKESAFEIQLLPRALAGGPLDSRLRPFDYGETRRSESAFWLRLRSVRDFMPDGVPAVNVHKGRHLSVQLFAPDGAPLALAAELPRFRGAHDAVFVLPRGLEAGESLYARVHAAGRGAEELTFSAARLDQTLARGAERARMIALTFGALMAMALAALTIWFVLSDKLFILYATLIALQALYIAYLSGQGFDWPGFSSALPLTSHAWNVPAALSGAVACLFVREIADLGRFSPRVYAASDTLGVWGERLIAHADAAVYAAKRTGRNRVRIAMPLAA